MKKTILFILYIAIFTKAQNTLRPINATKNFLTISYRALTAFAINNNSNAVGIFTERGLGGLPNGFFAAYFNKEREVENPSTGWSEAQKINVTNTTSTTFPYIAINNMNEAILVWTNKKSSQGTDTYEIFFSTINGNDPGTPQWQTPTLIPGTGTTTATLHSSFVGISNNTILVVYAESPDTSFSSDSIKWTYSADNGASWSNIETLQTNVHFYNPLSENLLSKKSFYMEKIKGYAALIWYDVNNKVQSSLFSNTTRSWSNPLEISASAFNQIQGRSISVNQNENMVASFIADNKAFGAIYTNGSWTSEEIGQLLTNQVAVASDCDINNNDHAIAVGINRGPSTRTTIYSNQNRNNTNWSDYKEAFANEVTSFSPSNTYVRVANDDKGNALAVSDLIDENNGLPLYTRLNDLANQWSPIEGGMIIQTDLVQSIDVVKIITNINFSIGGAFFQQEINNLQQRNVLGIIALNTTDPLNPGSPTDLNGTCLLTQYPLQKVRSVDLQWNPSSLDIITNQTVNRAEATGNNARQYTRIAVLPPTQNYYLDNNLPSGIFSYFVESIEGALRGTSLPIEVNCESS